DTYFVDNAGDRVVESSGGGHDLVWSSVSYILGSQIEDLSLNGFSAIDGAGNALDNRLTGNDYANVLDGKAGADTMIGQGGNDIYLVDNAGDSVIELAGQGFDEVRSTVSFRLDEEIEALKLMGSAKIDGVGNRLANTLTGNAAGNLLDGRSGNDTLSGEAGNDVLIGGLGLDRMTGGTGSDRFVFQAAADTGTFSWTADVISDFSRAQKDKINLSALDGNTDLAGKQGLSFIGSGAFSGAGQVRTDTGSGSSWIYVNLDEDLTDYEMLINLTGEMTLKTGDFLL
ncbi:MAG: M10 family metallopeptidase C-terminal domain-containing protein, partial [Alphaproteobacteria bacterium]|nr:M10 family metallopeptidase C-terminal domain-containing protein [Alphaproteobacteria bacterium]